MYGLAQLAVGTAYPTVNGPDKVVHPDIVNAGAQWLTCTYFFKTLKLKLPQNERYTSHLYTISIQIYDNVWCTKVVGASGSWSSAYQGLGSGSDGRVESANLLH